MKIIKAIANLFSYIFKIDRDSVTTIKPTAEEEENFKLFDLLADSVCPKCRTQRQITTVARGGVSMNVQCQQCYTKYWMSPIREFGAREIK